MVNNAPYIYWRTILFGDTDAAGVVYTPRFSEYCMEAAEFWFREYACIDWYQQSMQGLGTPVVHMELDFKAPLVGNDQLGVVVQVAKIGRTTVTLLMKGIGDRKTAGDPAIIFTAKFVFCFIKAESRRPYDIPNDQRRLIESYYVNCDGSASVNTETGKY
ncbi:hypothetical protein COB64_00980 [Candidatus Wolfebacteria bacterium]|nr:MAG: hypothetical protein COB64_00980 [Candidatus Wolfebacteria bacterium]